MRFASGSILLLAACAAQGPGDTHGSGAVDSGGPRPADTVLSGGRVYSLTWGEPDPAGAPARDAPRDADGWHPDASAVAIRGGQVVHVGTDAEAAAYIGPRTDVVELDGATVLPGLVDSHTHVVEMGHSLGRVKLQGVKSVEEILARLEAGQVGLGPGDWLLADGLDEGVWVHRDFDGRQLTARFPDRPVMVRGLHGFAAWGNQRVMAAAGIGASTPDPVGGEIRRDAQGPTGVVLNNAVDVLDDVVPPLSERALDRAVEAALRRMARDGYVAVHEAGTGPEAMACFERLESLGRLPIGVYVMLRADEPGQLEAWRQRGPDREGRLQVRAVKAYYDGSLGARGARLLEDYADAPGERGVSGESYGFDREVVAAMMQAGFQLGVHAIGDAGNRETLEFFRDAFAMYPGAAHGRHRIEHAQVVHPDDFAVMAGLGLTASMEPPHAVEDRGWAGDRLGPERLKGAYAWRTMREQGVPLIFNSDLPGSDHDIFYGLHAAVTRRDRALQPRGGWRPEQRVTPEEAVRGYTSWAARSAFQEASQGRLAPGYAASITVLTVDPFVEGERAPERILDGQVLLTIVDGEIVHDAR